MAQVNFISVEKLSVDDIIIDLERSDEPTRIDSFNRNLLIELAINEFEYLTDKEKVVIDVMHSRLADSFTAKAMRLAHFNLREPGFPKEHINSDASDYSDTLARLDAEANLICELCCNVAVIGFKCSRSECAAVYCRNCLRLLINLYKKVQPIIQFDIDLTKFNFTCLTCGEVVTAKHYDNQTIPFLNKWRIICHRIGCKFSGRYEQIKSHLSSCKVSKHFNVMLWSIPYVLKQKYAVELINHEKRRLDREMLKKQAEIERSSMAVMARTDHESLELLLSDESPFDLGDDAPNQLFPTGPKRVALESPIILGESESLATGSANEAASGIVCESLESPCNLGESESSQTRPPLWNVSEIVNPHGLSVSDDCHRLSPVPGPSSEPSIWDDDIDDDTMMTRLINKKAYDKTMLGDLSHTSTKPSSEQTKDLPNWKRKRNAQKRLKLRAKIKEKNLKSEINKERRGKLQQIAWNTRPKAIIEWPRGPIGEFLKQNIEKLKSMNKKIIAIDIEKVQIQKRGNLPPEVAVWVAVVNIDGTVVWESIVKWPRALIVNIGTVFHGLTWDHIRPWCNINYTRKGVLDLIFEADFIITAGCDTDFRSLLIRSIDYEAFRIKVRDIGTFYSPRQTLFNNMQPIALRFIVYFMFEKVTQTEHHSPVVDAFYTLLAYLLEYEEIEIRFHSFRYPWIGKTYKKKFLGPNAQMAARIELYCDRCVSAKLPPWPDQLMKKTFGVYNPLNFDMCRPAANLLWPYNAPMEELKKFVICCCKPSVCSKVQASARTGGNVMGRR